MVKKVKRKTGRRAVKKQSISGIGHRQRAQRRSSGPSGSHKKLRATPAIPTYYITSNTKVLCHCDETGSNLWTNDATAHLIYESGNVTLSPQGTAKFGDYSAAMDGDDGLALINHADFYPTDEDFTIDMWIYFTGWNGAGAQALASIWKGGGSFIWTYNHQNSLFYFSYNYPGTVTITSDSFVAETGQWYHFAAIRYEDNLTFYVNGVDYGGGAIGAIQSHSDYLYFGCIDEPTKYGLVGYMDEIDYHIGEARWTEEFTPPTGPYEAE
jgi:hypothetical protein